MEAGFVLLFEVSHECAAGCAVYTKHPISGIVFLAYSMFSITAYIIASVLLLVAGFYVVDRRQLEPD